MIASNNGATADPQWYRNLLVDPYVTVETPGHQFKGQATPLEGVDHEQAWADIKAGYPFVAEHEQRARRRIPVVALTKAD